MPIKFRCVYCERLLGIAHRKSGTEISCPKCKGRMRVPEAVKAAQTSKSNAGGAAVAEMPTSKSKPAKLFEDNDFEKLLTAGTLPSVGRDGMVLPSQPSKETQSSVILAEQNVKSDRELFELDYESAPPAGAVPKTEPLPEAGMEFAGPTRNLLYLELILSWLATFGLGILAGYFLFKK